MTASQYFSSSNSVLVTLSFASRPKSCGWFKGEGKVKKRHMG